MSFNVGVGKLFRLCNSDEGGEGGSSFWGGIGIISLESHNELEINSSVLVLFPLST